MAMPDSVGTVAPVRPDSDLAAGAIDARRTARHRVLSRVRHRRGRYDMVPLIALLGAVTFSVAVWIAAAWAAIQILG